MQNNLQEYGYLIKARMLVKIEYKGCKFAKHQHYTLISPYRTKNWAFWIIPLYSDILKNVVRPEKCDVQQKSDLIL